MTRRTLKDFFSFFLSFISSSAAIKLGDATALLVPHHGHCLPTAKNKRPIMKCSPCGSKHDYIPLASRSKCFFQNQFRWQAKVVVVLYRTRLYRPIYMDYVYGGGRREIERGRMTARRNHGGRDKSLNILPRQRNTRRLPYPERIT